MDLLDYENGKKTLIVVLAEAKLYLLLFYYPF